MLKLNKIKPVYITSNIQWSIGRRVIAKALSGGGGHRFESGPNHNFYTKNRQPITGCHVAALDWATWHPTNQPQTDTCQTRCRFIQVICHATSLSDTVLHSVTCHIIPTSSHVIRATCHPSSGDTCHLWIGPSVRQKSKSACHMSLPEAATCHLYGPATCHLYGHATSASVRTVRTAQSTIFFFACLTFRTECDIFSIRTPFDKVNIPPESGRRDGRNGTGFVAFRALSFLSIFQALSGFWIRFRTGKLPTGQKALGQLTETPSHAWPRVHPKP
jgi:hypothetical protein